MGIQIRIEREEEEGDVRKSDVDFVPGVVPPFDFRRQGFGAGFIGEAGWSDARILAVGALVPYLS
jgi:hypothetical protein